MILGLDISLNQTGLAIYDKNSKNIIYTNVITHNKNATEAEKLINIQNSLIKLFKQYDIKQTIIEDTFFSANVKTLKKLMKAHGVAISVLNTNVIPYEYITPNEAKKAVLGKIQKGTDTKKLVAQEICKLFPILQRSSLTNDETDAISLIIAKVKKDV